MITLRALKLRKFQSAVGYIMAKNFVTKLDPNIEPTSQETHFNTICSTSIFEVGLGNFRSFFSVRKRMFESKLLKRFEVQLNMLFRSGITQTSLLDSINLCPS